MIDEIKPEDEELREMVVPTAKRSVGRPKKGFTLYINCAPIRISSKPINLSEVFLRVSKKLADDQQADSFFSLPVFSSGSYPGRRDALARATEGLVEAFGTEEVTATTGNPDIDVMVRVLEAFATTVVKAIH